jgi:tripartite-type tricarboxylate transporter receptor subunit TctC
MKTPHVLLALAFAVGLGAGNPADAAEGGAAYPARSVRMVVPFAPGGSDISARILAQKLTEKLGQPFVVENRAGASGVLGAEVVAKSTPDGYTVLFCTASHAVTAVYFKKVPYDPIRDFIPVASVGSVPFVLVTHPALPVRSIKGFVALAKARAASATSRTSCSRSTLASGSPTSATREPAPR